MASFLDRMLLSPTGKMTWIERRHYRAIGRFLSLGDRVVWQRPCGLIHAAIVVGIDTEKGALCVYQRSKVRTFSVEVNIQKVKLEKQRGELYRCDDDLEAIPLSKTLRIMLNKLGEKGYNLFGKNCQHLVDECKRQEEKKESFQSVWFAVNMVVQALKIFGVRSITSEVIEKLFGGAEKIGVVTIVSLQTVFFLIEFYAAYKRLKAGDISWKHFTSLVIRQFSMAFLSCIGSAVGGSLGPFIFRKVIVWLVLSVISGIIADYLLDLWDINDICYRYLGWFAGGIVFGICGCATPDFVIEIILALLLGFGGLVLGHTFGCSASRLFNSQAVNDCRMVSSLSDLKMGDHITRYEWLLHPHCHAIFVEAIQSENKMTIIRNTYGRGVVEETVPFTESVYRYEYDPEECYNEERTIDNARSKIGEEKYNWFIYDCKTFAQRCKCRKDDQTDAARAPPQQAVKDWDEICDEMISDIDEAETVEMLTTRFKEMKNIIHLCNS